MTEKNAEEKGIVVVTGGTRGIGKAIVERLANDGYRVFCSGTECGERVLGAVEFHSLKLQDLRSVDRFVAWVKKRALEWNAKVVGLVNNAGICETASIGTKEFDRVMNRVLKVNLIGTAWLTNVFLGERLIGDSDHPSAIVNISSQLGKVGREKYSAYCASKFALIGLTEVWSQELAYHRGVRVNAVCPGWIETEMMDEDLKRLAREDGDSDSVYRNRLLNSLDQRRFNTPQEVANLVAFLISDEASGITGRAFELAGPSA